MSQSTKNAVNGNTLLNIKGHARLFNNTTLELVSYFIICIVSVGLIYNYSKDQNGDVTCDNYVFNTYLYIILALAIMSIIIISLTNSPYASYFNKAPVSLFLICFIILCVVRYLLLIYINPSSTIKTNIVWLIGIIACGLVTVILANISHSVKISLLNNLSDILFTMGIYSIVVLIIFGLLMNYITYLQTINWHYLGVLLIYIYLSALLVGGVYITDTGNFQSFFKNMIIFTVILYIVIIAINHIDVVKNAQTCSKLNPPDYPSETFNFIYLLRRLLFDIFYLPFKGN